jgi:NAD(P)-dependent dehydrogenase (short-subunit alcohol dehydrogenase family)
MSEGSTSDAAGKLALVTGANKGIGFEIARGLGQKGATVLLGARNAQAGEDAAARLRDEGLDAHFLLIDVTDEASVAAAARYEANVFGLVAVTQAMLPLLRKAPAGRIVNMSTGLASLKLSSGRDAPFSFSRLLAYNTSKTTVNGITVQFANELLDTPIKVNAANPGLCATDLSNGKGRPPSEGAAVAVELALLGEDGPTGGLYGDQGQVPW